VVAEVRLEQLGPVALLTLDNGPLNLLTRGVRAQLREHAERLATDPTVRAVVLRGGDRAFSAGSDIKEFPPDAATGLELARGEHACCTAVAAMPQPVIAALRGHILGGGLELAVACDLRIAEEDAVLGLPEVGLGVFPGECVESLPRLIGPSRAKRLLLLGGTLSAQEAEHMGLVDAVVPRGQAEEVASRWADTIATHPGRAVQAIKAAIDQDVRGESADVRRAANEQTMATMFESHDAREGVQAFLEKRAPRFVHH
jgi:enoyl-CoA hydratase